MLITYNDPRSVFGHARGCAVGNKRLRPKAKCKTAPQFLSEQGPLKYGSKKQRISWFFEIVSIQSED